MTGLLAFLVLIGVLITVHEFGHYIVAKAFGVKVEAFSVGFGSPIVQFQWGETEYKLCWIPLGGYVRMLGQLDYELEDGEHKEVDSADIGRSITEQTPLVRILIYLAGPAMNLILPFFILTPFIALSENYQMVPDNTIGAVDSSMPAGKAGLEPGDQIVEINDVQVELFWQIREEISKYNGNSGPLRLKVKRSMTGQVDAVDVQPHPLKITHPFLGYEITRYQIGYQPAFLDASLGFLKTDNPLYAVGLRTGDRIAAVNDIEIENMVMFRRAIETLQTGDLAVIEALRTGPPIDTRFPFMREQKRVKLQLKVQAPFTLESAGVVHASICVEGIREDGPA
ncbi:MAG: RIP metalloprotease RseP, partial [Bradymonadia bacterium]